MTSQSPEPQGPGPASAPQSHETLEAIAGVSLRLMAGTVSRNTMDALKRTVLSSPEDYPWRVVNQVVLGESVDEQRLAEQGIRAQRDWILRGGRENPGKPVGLKVKTFFAKLVAQSIFGLIFAAVLVLLLLLIKHKWPEINIYWLLDWVRETFPNLLPR